MDKNRNEAIAFRLRTFPRELHDSNEDFRHFIYENNIDRSWVMFIHVIYFCAKEMNLKMDIERYNKVISEIYKNYNIKEDNLNVQMVMSALLITFL